MADRMDLLAKQEDLKGSRSDLVARKKDLDGKFTPVAVVKQKYPGFFEARNLAVEQGKTYGFSEEHNARGDALRHIVWQALLAKNNQNLAKAVGDWHELPIPRVMGGGGIPVPKWLGGAGYDVAKQEAEMDQFNNAIGRDIAKRANSIDDIYRLAKEAVDSGKAKYTPVDQLDDEY